MKYLVKHFLPLLMGSILLVSCKIPQHQLATPTLAPNLVYTAAAQTVEAISTQRASVPTSKPTQPALPSQTPTRQAPPQATNTLQIPVASPTTGAVGVCDKVTFVRDITIPDGMVLLPSMQFTKTWELKNTGTCIWNPQYMLAFVEGHSFNAPLTVPLSTAPVAPEQVVPISITLTAPNTAGTYKGFWKLKNPSGQLFGIGEKADKAFWIDIRVGDEFSFLDGMCSADIASSTTQKVPCPNKEETKGFYYRLDQPKFMNGYKEDESSLVMIPPPGENTQISARFPAMKVPDGAHFRSVLGCLEGGDDCKVQYILEIVTLDTNKTTTLGSWYVNFDSQLTNVDIDLSGFAGKSVNLVMIVRANGAAKRNWAAWIMPRFAK